jgi:hypothetical protein
MCEVEEEQMPSVPRTPPYQQGNNHCSDDPYLDQHKLAYGVVYIYSYNFFFQNWPTTLIVVQILEEANSLCISMCYLVIILLIMLIIEIPLLARACMQVNASKYCINYVN